MRVSYSLGSLLSVHDVLECTRTLAHRDVDTIWIPETWGMECFGMLGAVSQTAPKPRLGSSIINVYSRTPALVAMGAITADTLSGGRLILGLGASSPAIVKGLHGMEHDSPLRRVREYIEAVNLACSKTMMGPDAKNGSGFSTLLKPVRPHIPIYVAAVGPKMLDLACEIADGVILYLRPLAELAKTSARISRDGFDVCSQIITAISHDEEAAIKRAKSTISFYIAVGDRYREFLARNGYESVTSSIMTEYQKTHAAYNPSLVPDSMARELAIFGSPESCVQQLRRFTDAGVTHPILQFNPVGDVRESFSLLCSAFSEPL